MLILTNCQRSNVDCLRLKNSQRPYLRGPWNFLSFISRKHTRFSQGRSRKMSSGSSRGRGRLTFVKSVHRLLYNKSLISKEKHFARDLSHKGKRITPTSDPFTFHVLSKRKKIIKRGQNFKEIDCEYCSHRMEQHQKNKKLGQWKNIFKGHMPN